jgi:hypothetical protein
VLRCTRVATGISNSWAFLATIQKSFVESLAL